MLSALIRDSVGLLVSSEGWTQSIVMILIMASLTQKMIKYEGVVIKADRRRVIRGPYFVIILSQANGWAGPGLSLGSMWDKYKITLDQNKPPTGL